MVQILSPLVNRPLPVWIQFALLTRCLPSRSWSSQDPRCGANCDTVDRKDNRIKLELTISPRAFDQPIGNLFLSIFHHQKNSSTTDRANPHHVFWWDSDWGGDQLSTCTHQWIQNPVHHCYTFCSFSLGDDLSFSKIPCSMAHDSWIQDGWLDHLSRLCKNMISFCRVHPVLTVNQVLSWGSFVAIYYGIVPFSFALPVWWYGLRCQRQNAALGSTR